jgi:recombination protein RecT
MSESTEVAQTEKVEKKKGVVTLIEQYAPLFAEALPQHKDRDAWLRAGVAAIKAKPKLLAAAENNPAQTCRVFMEAARLGHDVGTPEFYLIPRKNKDNGWREELTGLEGYRGIVERIYRAGAVSSVTVEVVRENDDFEYVIGRDAKPVHKIDHFGGDRGEMIGAYAYADMRDGGVSRVIVMDKAEIYEHRARSDAYTKFKSGPWITDEKSMWLKGLAVDTPILTPFGWSTMGALVRGNLVFDMNGQLCRIIDKSEVKSLPCYRITFANGEEIVCDEEHFWFARIGQEGKHSRDWRVHPIADLAEAKALGKAIVMPITDPVDLPRRELPIDPWVLGFWLGDGHHRSGCVTIGERDLDEAMAAIRSAGYEIGAVRKDSRSSAHSVRIIGLTKLLANAGLLGHKHIPNEYLFCSVEQRVALLRGLMDSDGTIDKARGRAVFGNTNRDLSAGVAHLARSLGEVINTRDQVTTGFGKQATSAVVSWRPTTHIPVTLSRKVAGTHPRRVAPYRSVRSIERIEPVQTQCISVDSPTKSYLAGVDLVPTHNTVARALEPWVPTSSEYMRERMRMATEIATAKVHAEAEAKRAEVPDSLPDDQVVVDGEVEESAESEGDEADS